MATILIAGEAKSGTTALYYKTKKGMPKGTVGFFEHRQSPLKGVPKILAPRNIISKIIVQEYLEIDYREFRDFEKRVFIARDPRDRLVSRLLYSVLDASPFADSNHTHKFIELLRKKEHIPHSVTLLDLQRHVTPTQSDSEIKMAVERQLKFTEAAIDQLQPQTIVKYEDMIDGKLDTLEAYLGFGVQKDTDVDDRHSYVVRAKRYGDWKYWLTQEEVSFWKDLFEPFLNRFGYESDWELAPCQTIDPEHSSNYVKKLADKRYSRKESTGKNDYGFKMPSHILRMAMLSLRDRFSVR